WEGRSCGRSTQTMMVIRKICWTPCTTRRWAPVEHRPLEGVSKPDAEDPLWSSMTSVVHASQNLSPQRTQRNTVPHWTTESDGSPKAGVGHVLSCYRFDPVYATCYKCPFCSGKPGIGTYLSLFFFSAAEAV